jgi:hypothetical protein
MRSNERRAKGKEQSAPLLFALSIFAFWNSVNIKSFFPLHNWFKKERAPMTVALTLLFTVQLYRRLNRL